MIVPVEKQNLIANKNISVSEAMKKIDANLKGILFFVDENGILVACISDGDVRRYLLSGGEINGSAYAAANKKPRVVESIEEAKAIYDYYDYKVIPIVDSELRIVDFYTGEEDKTDKYHQKLGIPVVINAGGRGTRLNPFTKVLPKPLIPVGEFPIIELIMREYQSYECCDFHVIVNYKKELIKAYFYDSENSFNITWYDEDKPLGTGGGLSLLRGKLDSTFFFSNCDVLLTENYKSILDFHKDNNNAITMVCAYKNVDIPYGIVEIDNGGIIKSMKEKPTMSFLTNTGIYIVEPDVLEDIAPDTNIGFPGIIEKERDKGKKVAVFTVSESKWMDMGQLNELDKMRKRLYGE